MRRSLILSGVGVALFGLLAGCARDPSITDSDVWQRRQGEAVVSVCYTAATATRDQVVALAAAECPANRPYVQLVDEDTFFNNCPLSKRTRATFLCVAQ